MPRSLLGCAGSKDRDPQAGSLPSPPTPPLAADSMRDAIYALRNKSCALREVPGTSSWVLEFQRTVPYRPMRVDRVGADFVRLTLNGLRYDVPFAAIALVTSDD